ncbi:Uncharacterised protein [Vibrio cholerae]|nr:Uncharacterised protein [Vibrio cholerae]
MDLGNIQFMGHRQTGRIQATTSDDHHLVDLTRFRQRRLNGGHHIHPLNLQTRITGDHNIVPPR